MKDHLRIRFFLGHKPERIDHANPQAQEFLAGRRSASRRTALPQGCSKRSRRDSTGSKPQNQPGTTPGDEVSFANIARKLNAKRQPPLLTAIDKHCGNLRPDQIRGHHLAAACGDLGEYSLAYRHVMHSRLKWIARAAGISWEIWSTIPHLRAAQPKETTVPEAEFEAVLRVAPPFLEIVMLLAHEAGLRADTAAHFTRGNADFDRERVTGTTKGGAKYDVPMTSRLRERMLWWCAAAHDAREPLTAIYRVPRVEPTASTLRTAIRNARVRAGVKGIWGIHDLRRTAARRLYASTRDIRKVQAFLGHQMLYTTCWYLGNGIQHLQQSDLEQAAHPQNPNERTGTDDH